MSAARAAQQHLCWLAMVLEEAAGFKRECCCSPSCTRRIAAFLSFIYLCARCLRIPAPGAATARMPMKTWRRPSARCAASRGAGPPSDDWPACGPGACLRAAADRLGASLASHRCSGATAALAPPALSQRFRLALQECGVAVIASAPVRARLYISRPCTHTTCKLASRLLVCASWGPPPCVPKQAPLGMLLCVCCHVAYRPCRGPTDIKPAGRWIGSKQQSRGERQSSSQSIRRKLRHKEASDTKSNKEASGGAPTTAPRAAGCPPPPPPAARCSCARCRPAPLEGCASWRRTGMYRH